MLCHEFTEVAGEWMEGHRPPDAAAHLAACTHCRGLIADLESIQATAGALDDAVPAPPERVWTALYAQLEAESVVRRGGWNERVAAWFAVLPRPALAGAYLALALAAAVLFSFQRGTWQAPVERAPVAMAAIGKLPAQLTAVDERAVSSLHAHDRDVSATYRHNLVVVDNLIRMCEESLRKQPGNDLAREYLYSAYQQKAEMLGALAERRALGD